MQVTPLNVTPQNPYASYLVAASAGSGKTYQLSRRFLFLIAAGAEPQSVLTVTFTKKAAGEMRARILGEAARLAADPKACEAFNQEIRRFHAEANGAFDQVAPPKDAGQVAEIILGSSQSLKISTIDSLFLDWVMKFPFETADNEANLGLAESLLDTANARELGKRAWRATCQVLSRGLKRGDALFAGMTHALAETSTYTLEERLAALDRQETFIWYCEHVFGSALKLHRAPGQDPSLEASGFSHAEAMQSVESDLRLLAAALNDKERQSLCLEATRNRDFAQLLQSGILSKTHFGVNGRFFRGKKREAMADAIGRIEEAIRRAEDAQRRQKLNATGQAQYDLYRLFRALREELKKKARALEFRDLVKGGHRLFHGEKGAGVRFLLARTVQHLLLDEFQDTSRLQWAVFGEMATQMLSGAGIQVATGLRPTVFVVGDAKQSIYGFREADPYVIEDAQNTFRDQLQLAPLTESYRTAQIVLDFVNAVFAPHARLAAFSTHKTAQTSDGQPFVPDIGRVMLAPLLEGQGDLPAERREANLLAATLAKALTGELPCPVYDKTTNRLRPLRPSDCAILYRSKAKADQFEAALLSLGIPCQREEEHGFFARQEIKDALALLRFLAFPADLLALATVLRSPLGQINDQAFLELLTASKGSPDRSTAILALLKEKDALLATTLAWLLSRTGRLLPHELLVEALVRLDALRIYARPEFYGPSEAQLATRNLLRLVELLLQLEDDGASNLPRLLSRLETKAQDDDVGNAVQVTGSVTLMTIHKSKGLEFPLVALVDSGRPWGQSDTYWIERRGGGGVDSGLFYIGKKSDQPLADSEFQGLVDRASSQTAEECQRLLYVGLTRARQYLLLTGHKTGRNVGLEETAVYEQLREASERWSASSGSKLTYEVNGVTWASWERTLDSDTDAAVIVAAPAETTTSTKPSLPWDEFLPITAVPRELVVKSPSKHEEKSRVQSELKSKSSLSPKIAAAIGDFLHKGLERFMRTEPFQASAYWRQNIPLAAQGLEAIWTEELQSLMADKTLLRLKHSAREIHAEMPLVHRRGEQVVVGTVDLLVEDRQGNLLIVDYKTTQFAGDDLSALTEDQLITCARERGWAEQLNDYAEAIKAIYPGKHVSTHVYFTSLRRLVALGGERAKKRRVFSTLPAWRQLELFR